MEPKHVKERQSLEKLLVIAITEYQQTGSTAGMRAILREIHRLEKDATRKARTVIQADAQFQVVNY